MWRETKTAVNRFANKPKLSVMAKPLTGPVPNKKQDDGRNNGRHVGIDNRHPGMREALIDRRRGHLAGSQFFPYALKDQHVRIDAHADGENYAGDSREGQTRLPRSP